MGMIEEEKDGEGIWTGTWIVRVLLKCALDNPRALTVPISISSLQSEFLEFMLLLVLYFFIRLLPFVLFGDMLALSCLLPLVHLNLMMALCLFGG